MSLVKVALIELEVASVTKEEDNLNSLYIRKKIVTIS